MLSTFSRLVPSKVYEAWIFLIRFLVSCIILHLTGWNLIPHFLAQEPNRSISLWSFIVSFSSLISLISVKKRVSLISVKKRQEVSRSVKNMFLLIISNIYYWFTYILIYLSIFCNFHWYFFIKKGQFFKKQKVKNRVRNWKKWQETLKERQEHKNRIYGLFQRKMGL